MAAFATREQKLQRRLSRLNREGWLYGGLPGLQWEVANARQADPELVRSIHDDVKRHPGFHDYYHACINCGNCTAVCPAFRFADFAPRVVVQKVMHSACEPELLFQMVDQYIWACFQCYSCWDVCPAQNNPGGLVAIVKEAAVRHGVDSTKRALQPYSRILYKLMTTGTQITPDMHSTVDLFRDWGPHKAELADHLEAYRDAVPVKTLAGVYDKSWEVDQRTMEELLVIEREAGVIDMVKASAEDVGEIIEEEALDVQLEPRPPVREGGAR